MPVRVDTKIEELDKTYLDIDIVTVCGIIRDLIKKHIMNEGDQLHFTVTYKKTTPMPLPQYICSCGQQLKPAGDGIWFCSHCFKNDKE